MRQLSYATVCSGIECMSAACADLPMMPVFFSEIEPFPCAVLKSHFPDVPNLGDMSKIEVSNNGKEITNGPVRIVLDERLDIFAGGTPCQDVSVAGKRSGMQEGSGTRSSIAFEFVRLVRELKPRFVIWENVAGVLSDKSFPEFLIALANCGYGVAYRTLDAQWVRVADCHHEDGGVVRMERAIPQRRRRVWVVGYIGGDVTKAAQILFEQKGVAGDNPPRRRTGQEIAAASRGRNRVHGEMVGEAPGDGETIALDGDKLKPRTDQRKGGNGFGINEDGAGYTFTGVDQHGVAMSKEECCHTLGTCNSESPNNDKVVKVAIGFKAGQSKDGGLGDEREVSPTLSHNPSALEPTMAQSLQGISQMKYIVRRLTPTECERLMGLPGGWTIPQNLEVTDALVEEFREKHDTFKRIMAEYENEPPPKPTSTAQVRKWLEKITNPDTCPDSPRYKGCGNGWATNQPRWILLRLLAVEGIDPWWGEFDEAKEAKENSDVSDN